MVLVRLVRTHVQRRLRESKLSHVNSFTCRKGKWLNLKINEHAPQSATDWAFLQLTRQVADCVVTTGSIVRSEPDMVTAPVKDTVVLTRDVERLKVETAGHKLWAQPGRVVAVDGGLAAAVRYAREELRAERISVEAGFATAREMYEEGWTGEPLQVALFGFYQGQQGEVVDGRGVDWQRVRRLLPGAARWEGGAGERDWECVLRWRE